MTLTTDEILGKTDKELLEQLYVANTSRGQDVIKAILDMRREEANRKSAQEIHQANQTISKAIAHYTKLLAWLAAIQVMVQVSLEVWKFYQR